MRRKRTPSRKGRSLLLPSRLRARMGTKVTLWPAFIRARHDVVGYEKPLGSRGRTSSSRSRRAARKPDVRSAMGRPVSQEASALKHGVAEARAARPGRRGSARRRPCRTRPPRATRAAASSGSMLPVGVQQQHHLARAPRGCPSSRPRRCPCCRGGGRRARPPAAARSAVRSDEPSSTTSTSSHWWRARTLAHDVRDGLLFVECGDDDRRRGGFSHGPAPAPAPPCARGRAGPRAACGWRRSGRP